MEFDLDALSAMAAEIWESMLGIELTPVGEPEAASTGERTLTGCVQITGEWAGAVTVKCPTALARVFAAAMFMSEPDGLDLDEVFDAFGELTNMTGGSVKGMVPGDCQLGIPAVAEGLDYSLTLPRGVAVAAVGFRHAGQPLEIVVYENK